MPNLQTLMNRNEHRQFYTTLSANERQAQTG